MAVIVNVDDNMNGHKGLRVYQLAYELSMEIFRLTKTFPVEERYSLTDQIRRSSRAISSNIAEGYRKRQYPKMFVNKMSDADGEVAETQTWLDYSRDCEYISVDVHDSLYLRYESVGSMLGNMMRNPDKFAPRGSSPDNRPPTANS